MNDIQLETLDQVRQFLDGTEAISFQIESKDARYRWIRHGIDNPTVYATNSYSLS